jgi:division protein CdvB (Snf7/Vps24/ESCRT-III family)
VVFEAARKLKMQRVRLEQVVLRLRHRDKVLFQTCTWAVKKNNEERALIYANEIAEVRKLARLVSQTQILLERVILRLETIQEISSIMADLKPALQVLHGLTGQLFKIMPDMAHELQTVNDSISETLAMTKISSSQEIIPQDFKTPGGEEILSEVSTILEEKLEERLPQPPPSIPVRERVESAKKVKQMVALTATCSEICEEKTPNAYSSYKDVKMKSVSFKLQRSSSLEDDVLQYVKTCNGEISVDQCSEDLDVPSKEVEEILANLDKKGRIMINR